MKCYYLIIGFLLFSSSCKPQADVNHLSHDRPTIEDLIKNLEDSKNDQIIVIAHRGIWHNAPENS